MKQIGARKKRLAIDNVTTSVNTVQRIWVKKNLAGALFMDVKGAFDHVSKATFQTYD